MANSTSASTEDGSTSAEPFARDKSERHGNNALPFGGQNETHTDPR
jgi:hypothetical protein